MLGVSSLYHRLQWSPAARSIVRRLDHSTIFLAIAGAYTPVVGAALSGWRRPTVLIVAWAGAVVGITLQWVRIHVPRAVSTAVYVVVGWSSALGVHAVDPRARRARVRPAAGRWAARTRSAPSCTPRSGRILGHGCSASTRCSTCARSSASAATSPRSRSSSYRSSDATCAGAQMSSWRCHPRPIT